jgi:hypothetical protein
MEEQAAEVLAGCTTDVLAGWRAEPADGNGSVGRLPNKPR